jgi:hypothetical protein
MVCHLLWGADNSRDPFVFSILESEERPEFFACSDAQRHQSFGFLAIVVLDCQRKLCVKPANSRPCVIPVRLARDQLVPLFFQSPQALAVA